MCCAWIQGSRVSARVRPAVLRIPSCAALDTQSHVGDSPNFKRGTYETHVVRDAASPMFHSHTRASRLISRGLSVYVRQSADVNVIWMRVKHQKSAALELPVAER